MSSLEYKNGEVGCDRWAEGCLERVELGRQESVNVSRVLQDKTVSNVSGKLEGTGTGISLRELFRWLRESQPS